MTAEEQPELTIVARSWFNSRDSGVVCTAGNISFPVE